MARLSRMSSARALDFGSWRLRFLTLSPFPRSPHGSAPTKLESLLTRNENSYSKNPPLSAGAAKNGAPKPSVSSPSEAWKPHHPFMIFHSQGRITTPGPRLLKLDRPRWLEWLIETEGPQCKIHPHCSPTAPCLLLHRKLLRGPAARKS